MKHDDEAPDCPMCASTPELLGRMGFMAHYRCRACGWTFMDPPDSPTRVSEAEHRAISQISSTVATVAKVGDTISFKSPARWGDRKATRKVVGHDQHGRALVGYGGYKDFVVKDEEILAIRAHHNEEYDAGLDDVDGRYPVDDDDDEVPA